MDIRNQYEKHSQWRPQRPQSVALPHGRDGIGNALRSAFDASNWGIPDDMRQLLARLDR